MPFFRDLYESWAPEPVEERSTSYSDVWGTGGSVDDLALRGKGARGRKASLAMSTAFGCISLKADSWGQLPLRHYSEGADGTKVPVPPSARARWTIDPTGEGDTAFYLGESISTSFDTDGNFYAEILTGRHNEPIAAIPLDPTRCRVSRVGGKKAIDVTLDSGAIVRAEPYRRGMKTGVLHIPGLRLPGTLSGLSPLDLAQAGVGLGLTAEEYGRAFFHNGARPDVVIELPENVKADDGVRERLRKGWSDRHQGPTKAHRPGVLTEGAKLNTVSIQPDHAQFLETRNFQREDVASFFRVPPHMVGIVSKVTSYGAGLTEQSTGFVRFTMTPPVVRAELAVSNALLPRGQGIDWDHNGLTRGTIAERYKSYSVGKSAEFLSTNDIRRSEGMPTIGPEGDKYENPNTGSSTSNDDEPEPPPPPAKDEPEEGDE